METQAKSNGSGLNKSQQIADKKNDSTCLSMITNKIVKIFDLDLLKDRIYVNIMLGLSLAIIAEINFSLLTPFILTDLNYSTEQIASIMSLLAIADIIVRFISPFIGDYFSQPPRIMYMYSLLLLLLGRTSKLHLYAN